MQAKLVMASLKGEQLRTTLELLMPTLGMGAFFYCYKAIPLEGPLYLVCFSLASKISINSSPNQAHWFTPLRKQ